MTPTDRRHGTSSGYTAHYAEGALPPCQACRDARVKEVKRYRLRLERSGQQSVLVPALGVVRRIQALQWAGWPLRIIAQEAGWSSKRSVQCVFRCERVSVRTHQRIDDVYQRLAHLPGPSELTRRRAHAAGYAPALAWDDIDNPREQPKGVLREVAS